jgi:hypothetical protein
MTRPFYFFYLIEIFAQIQKINMKREYSTTFFKRKNSLNLQKNKNNVTTFPYWFGFGNKILNV